MPHPPTYPHPPRTLAVRVIACSLAAALLVGCNLPVQTLERQFQPLLLSDASGSAPTATPFAPLQTLAPSPTHVPIYAALSATVWPSDPQAPVLLYHHFISDTSGKADDTHIRLGEFRSELQTLYDDGYSLVSLESWLTGDLRMPAGRRPLVITMDDLFFADQVFIRPDGTPSPNSGLGALWQFSQTHPGFGFNVALFANLGDKDYANVESGGQFIKSAGWEDSLARAIVWCIEHNAVPYNHFYRHPYLDHFTADQLTAEASQNDQRMKALLERAGRPELFDAIGNILALPYGHWPTDPAAMKALLAYQSPQGKPVLGIVEVGGIYSGHYLQAIYSGGFDPLHIPRMVGSSMGMSYLTRVRESFPMPQTVQVEQVDVGGIRSSADLAQALQAACQASACPDGIYTLDGGIIRLQNKTATALWPKP